MATVHQTALLLSKKHLRFAWRTMDLGNARTVLRDGYEWDVVTDLIQRGLAFRTTTLGSYGIIVRLTEEGKTMMRELGWPDKGARREGSIR